MIETTDWSKASGLERLIGPDVLDDPRVQSALEVANQAVIKFHQILSEVAAEKRLISYTRTDDLLVRKKDAI